MLRQTSKEGGVSRLPKVSVERTPSLHSLEGGAKQSGKPDVELQCLSGCGNREVLTLETDEVLGRCFDWVLGVRWSPEQFLKQACMVKHPFDSFSGLPSVVQSACDDLAKMSMADMVNLRCSKLGSWLKLAAQLKDDEAALKSSMGEGRRGILKSKRLLLMKHIIQQEGYDDVSLADDMINGFSLVGEVPRSNVLPHKTSPACLSTSDLKSNANRANKALRYMTWSSRDDSLDEKLWERTQTEVQRGWLEGPLNWEDLPEGAAVSRRFPISQSDKVRPIGDFSQSQVNATVTNYEQATVDGPDVICALAIRLMKQLKANGRSSSLVRRSRDLASAYRQLAISEESYEFAYLSIYNPLKNEAALFRQVALPFGSVTAVNAFIRCSRFLQWLAGHCLRIPMSCYFDDFVIFSPPALSNSSQTSLCLMLDILGWAFDREGRKSDTFSTQVSALGVVFDLGPTSSGRLEVHNTEKRLKEAVESLDRFIASKKSNKRDALTLRGRLAFCDAFVFGRLGKVSLQNITHHAYAKPFKAELDDAAMHSLRILRNRMANAKPRRLDLNLLDTFVLMTDAAFDISKGAGLGAVLVAPTGAVAMWFGLQLGLERLGVW